MDDKPTIFQYGCLLCSQICIYLHITNYMHTRDMHNVVVNLATNTPLLCFRERWEGIGNGLLQFFYLEHSSTMWRWSWRPILSWHLAFVHHSCEIAMYAYFGNGRRTCNVLAIQVRLLTTYPKGWGHRRRHEPFGSLKLKWWGQFIIRNQVVSWYTFVGCTMFISTSMR